MFNTWPQINIVLGRHLMSN